MNRISSLKDAYNQANYQLAQHGKRNIQVLKKAFQNVDGQLESDMYGSGKVIEDFQEKIAAFLSKEKSIFFPSGTMAQQIALRIWCDEKGIRKVAYHPLSHLEIHEQDGLKEIHHIETILLADKSRVIEFEDVVELKDEISCLLLELPQREIGGQLPSFETLEQISDYCKEKGIKLHLDGARLLEVLPYYKKSAAEISALFDSVYISFYKGIGGIAGAILAGDADFIAKSKVWKRRYGGDLISLYPYIIPADYYFETRFEKMGQYYENAKELAEYFNSCYGISTRPNIPVSNMFHVHFPYAKEEVEPILIEVQQQSGIGITSYLKDTDEQTCYFELSLGDHFTEIPKNIVRKTFNLLDQLMKDKFC
ncbi:MAG TPA: aminotransferase class I/II-fold pyridoxal phosphate-dependent enzyme [Bacillus sp. (in: firmicutes)]|uniref:threonine aldolase family protein n=1 Tax=Bacillus litorisediminis TaxID=2922713 RepID=UPI001FAC8DAA|nr:aminotransferase class I/II-fold pyridoxal phosphate-dependent enzyme [Bacillus litorisediminis]HWO75401.1 aminotransferase class I/II-fold pyridoxal phosphate-dependent enzyme [Bacillus sp. (in: firmicutes)]